MAGSSVDREIRISASDSGVFDKLSKLKEGALAMGRGIAEETKKQATSSRELIRLMNDEVAVLEKRNRLDKEGRELSAREKFGGAGGDDKALKSELQKISIESKEDKIQADLLKQILQAILKTSKEEVSADRNSVEKNIASDREIDAMDDHEAAIKQTFQRQLLSDTEPEAGVTAEDHKRKTSSGLAGVGNFVQNTDMYHMGYGAAGNFMTSQAGKVPNKLGKRLLMAGGVAAGAAGLGITSATDYYEGVGDLSRATGEGAEGLAGQYDGIDGSLDMTEAQAMKRTAQLIRSSSGRLRGKDDLKNLMALERGQGVSGETIGNIRQYTTGSGGNPFGATGTEVFGSARYVQKNRGLDHLKTEEILQLQSRMQKDQFMATGVGHLGTNTGIINRMLSNQQAAGQVASVDRAGETINQLGSFVQNGGEDMEAFKFTEFQRRRGMEGKSGSYLDYLEEKEKGVSGKIDDYAVDAILKQNKSDEDKLYTLHNMGFKISDSKAMMAGGGVGALDVEGIESRKLGGSNALGEAAAKKTLVSGLGLNSITQQAAGVTNALSEMGKAAIAFADWVTGSIPGKKEEKREFSNPTE